jgi:hypothetical protein
VADLEARVTEERTKREGSEQARTEAFARTQHTERALAQAQRRLKSLFAEHERVLGERDDERAEARRLAEERAADARLFDLRLSQEKKRVQALERELETLEAALARHVAGLSELGVAVSQARSEQEEVRAVVASDRARVAAAQSLDQPRLVFWVGGVLDATSAAVDALRSRSRPGLHQHLDARSYERRADVTLPESSARAPRPQAAMRDAGRWIADVLRHANERPRARAIQRAASSANPRPSQAALAPPASTVHDPELAP